MVKRKFNVHDAVFTSPISPSSQSDKNFINPFDNKPIRPTSRIEVKVKNTTQIPKSNSEKYRVNIITDPKPMSIADSRSERVKNPERNQ